MRHAFVFVVFALMGCGGSDADFVVADPPDTGSVDSSPVDTSVSDTSVPDTSVPDTSVPDSFVADTGQPDTSEPDTASLDASPEDSSAGDAMAEAGDAPDDALPDGVTPLDTMATDSADAALPCDAPLSCWVDKDGDGYAIPSTPIVACVCPSGTANRNPATVIDCNDEDPSVHPAALAYHDKPYCVPGSSCATKSFDYDCSGAAERFRPGAFGGCGTKSAGCPGVGWSGTIPECGAEGTLVTCSAGLLSCDMSSTKATQLCR